METKMNIFSEKWCNLLFSGRNKKYGAYVLRQESSKRHVMALALIVSLFCFVLALPSMLEASGKTADEQYNDPTVVISVEPDPIPVNTAAPKAEKQPKQVLKARMKVTQLVIVNAKLMGDVEEIKIQDEILNSVVAISYWELEGSKDPNAVDLNELNGDIVDEKDSLYILPIDVKPQFPGGEVALMHFLSKSIKYPQEALDNELQGMVMVQFTVNKTGNLEEIIAIKGIGGGCEEEAIRVVKTMPKWIPGIHNGNKVMARFTLPVRYKLE